MNNKTVVKLNNKLPTFLFIWFTQELDYKVKYTAPTVFKITSKS